MFNVIYMVYGEGILKIVCEELLMKGKECQETL